MRNSRDKKTAPLMPIREIAGAECHESGVLKTFFRRKTVCECAEHGQYEGMSFSLPGGGRVVEKCPECEKEKIRKKSAGQEEAERSHRERQWAERMKEARIGRLYWGDGLHTWRPSTPEQAKVLALCKQYVANFDPGNGRGLFFKGAAGTGKTHLAVGIVRAVMERGYSARYYTLSRLLSGVRGCYTPAATETEDAFYDRMTAYDLLVIDEIGVKTMSGDEFNTLYRVVDERYMERRCTILAANAGKADAESFLTGRIMDRLNETSLTVVFNWESHRGKRDD